MLVFSFSAFSKSENDSLPKKKRGTWVARIWSEMNRVDTNYVEPQHYNMKLMLKNVNTYEVYSLSAKNNQRITFSPKPSVKIGPYIGYSLFSFGYAIDIAHMHGNDNNEQRQEYDVSFYNSMLGLDVFYRKTGNDYKISRLDLGKGYEGKKMKGVAFSGVRSSIKGFNLYYIFNHRKFSYPAAFSQSTIQRRSVGSPLVGIGYTRHKLSVDWEALDKLVEEKLGVAPPEDLVNGAMKFSTIRYTDISFSGGWAYNWVFACNWLLASSLSAAIGYKRTMSDTETNNSSIKDRFRNFDTENFNLDGILRLGLVWNCKQWYAGLSSILHSYNYKKDNFSTNNTFGTVNVYVGFRFWRRND